MVAGGQGAPLVPLLDYVFFRDAKRGRVLQNIGGIANLTAIPPGAELSNVTAFDTGPGNMVIDAAMQALYGEPYDKGGRIAASGTVLAPVLQSALRHCFFSAKPPKSAGREEFGTAYSTDFLRRCKAIRARPQDAVATATALTVHSIRMGYESYVLPIMRDACVDYLLSGGGARNRTLVTMLRELLTPLGCKVGFSDDLGLPAQAKEAAAFALLAYQTWHRRPGNVPSATGAKRFAVLGDITYA